MINTSEHILVMLLSSALAVLLVLGIILAVLAVRLLKTANRIAEKAEHVATKAQDIGALLSKTITPIASSAAFRLFKTVFKIATKNKSRRKSDS